MTHQVEKIEPVRRKGVVAPTSASLREEAKELKRRQDLLNASSIEPALAPVSSPSPFEMSKPKLDRPSSAHAVIRQALRLEETSSHYLDQKGVNLEKIFGKVESTQQQLRDTIEQGNIASDQAWFWGVLSEVSSAVTSALSLSLGYSMLATNPLVGGAMIASGALSIGNTACKHGGMWDFVAKQIGRENSSLVENIATYLPAAIGLAASAIGVYGIYQAWGLSHLSSGVKFLSGLETAVQITQGMTQLGSGYASSHLKQIEATLLPLETDHQLFEIAFSKLITEMRDFEKGQEAIRDWIIQFIETQKNALHQITQQTV